MIQGFIDHIHKRKMQHKGLAPYPHPKPKMRMLDRVMLAASIVGPMANIPQIIRLYSLEDASSLSLTTWMLFFCINSLWICYGVAHKEKIIIFAGTSATVFNIPILIGIYIY